MEPCPCYSLIFALLALPGVVSFYSQPGIPPQCLDAYQCVFNRLPSDTGLNDTYTWDLNSLCRGAGLEYVASRAGSNNVIKFNLCGTVSKPVAPAPMEGGAQKSPIPHSHGAAIQLIDYDPANPYPPPPPGPNGDGTCADLDTCDYLYNPGYLGLTNPSTPGVCTIGSLNYQQGVSPSWPAREALCDPVIGGTPRYCSPSQSWCCSVKSVPCTGNEEVLSYYDSAPKFNLWNGSVSGGIYLTYPPVLNYAADPTPCEGTDPSTGNASTRSLTIRLDCDASVTTGLADIIFDEDPVQDCQFFIRARTAAACPTLVVPPNITCNATSPPVDPPSAASGISSSQATTAAVGSFLGGAVLSALVALAVVYLGCTKGCPKAPSKSRRGTTGSINEGEQQSPLLDTAGEVSMRFKGPPSHTTPLGLEAVLNDLTTAQFKLLREQGAINIKGELLGPVTLPPGDLDGFSVRQQITLGKLGVLLG